MVCLLCTHTCTCGTWDPHLGSRNQLMGTSLFVQWIAVADTQPPLTAALCYIVCMCSNRKGPVGITECAKKLEQLEKVRKRGWGCCWPGLVWLFLQHSSVDGFVEPPVPPTKSASRHSLPRCRNSFTSTEEHPHIGNYRLLKTIGKGNFAKVKLARHVLTGREVRVIYVL